MERVTKMKFKLLSDLHLEFYGARPFYRQEATPMWEPTATEDDAETILLLAGDIHVGRKAQPWIEKMCARYAYVIYILGNHEFYNQEMNDIRKFWKEVDMPDNFAFLDNDTIAVPGEDPVRIIGGTLWTGITDPFAIWNGRKMMTDYQIITVGDKIRCLTVEDTNKLHFETANFIRQELQREWKGKTIVMTHHLPHPMCVNPLYKGSNLNAFFMTNLDYIIRNFDIDVWVHGHTHDNVDIMVDKTRILCNPMGYHGIKLNQDYNEGLTFDL